MSGCVWADYEVEELRCLYPDATAAEVAVMLGRSVLAVYNMARKLHLSKSAVFKARESQAMRCRALTPNMLAHRFKHGAVPWNKGKPHRPRGSEKHWFKCGVLNGAAAMKELPLGSERVQDGVLVRKVATGTNRWLRWKPVHRMVWEAVHGDVPPGCIVVFKRGRHTTNAQDITLDRLECITRAENMHRNSRHTNYPPEVNQLMQLRGALNRKINNRSKRA